jgi:CRISPR-associated protein Cas5d
MDYRSKDYFIKVSGDYALFSEASSKGGGEKYSYSVPTRQALKGIVDAVYFKPVLTNVVDAVKVMRPIRTETKGIRALLGNGKLDLNYYTYLVDVEYIIKYHYEWNLDRPDLAQDRVFQKHDAILSRSIAKGGRRDVFLGVREAVGYIKESSQSEFENKKSFYDNQTIHLGIMFQEFEYPKESGGPLKSYFTNQVMKDGVISFKEREDCEIVNELSNYQFKYPLLQKSSDLELKEMGDEQWDS